MAVLPRITTTLQSGGGDGSFVTGIASRQGIQVVMDFYTYMALIGATYQIRAGTITTPLIGGAPNADTVAEMAIDAATSATVFIPTYLNIGMRLLTGTLHEYFAKSVATVSSAGTAFVPLPLRSDGGASVTTARVAAHAVTVTAELATTTAMHWAYSNPAAGATGALPTGGGAFEWNPRMPPILRGPRCFYVQVAATTTGPSYYAHADYIEGAAAALL